MKNKKLLRNAVMLVITHFLFSDVIIYVCLSIMYATGKKIEGDAQLPTWPACFFVKNSTEFITLFIIFIITSALFALLYYLIIVKQKTRDNDLLIVKSKYSVLKAFIYAGIIPFVLFIIEYETVFALMYRIYNNLI